ncbi:flavoprotein [Amycolatopsis sp. A1MSW2902]|uniref:flavin-containing monooxygenase n=1 Tax=Amycolatopsis sp. A1MSW2902 TaxID=687413 RepID=UPI00307D166F
MGTEYAETVIIGGGQQGCGTAAALQDAGLDAVLLERGEIGRAWAEERWDSLRLRGTNRLLRFPGWRYDGDEPDGFMSGPELAGHLRRYVARRGLRVRRHAHVRAVERVGEDTVRFRSLLSSGEVVESRNLVAALGGYTSPRVPDLSVAVDPSVKQVHSRRYRNPEELPDGAVLVVGAGISGQQIADELADAGRRVFLSVGRHRAFPRCYRGRSLAEWMYALSLYGEFATGNSPSGEGERSALPGLPVTATNDGRADLNLGTLARKGVVLVGSVRGADDAVVRLAENVVTVAEHAAKSFDRLLELIDEGVRERGLPVPEQRPAPRADTEGLVDFGPSLDLRRHGITAIVWCTGFAPDYRILPAEVLDERGAPLLRQGVRGAIPGLYFAGLPDGASLAPVGISANVENGRFIARQIGVDHLLRTGSKASFLDA